jgi:transketolase
MKNQALIDEIELFALQMRRSILDVSHACGLSTHLGGGLSMVEVMATLYRAVLHYDIHNPRWEDRDRFILSKGHGVLGYFSALVSAGIISREVFATFQTNESDLIAHPVMNLDLGIESSNGSLGQGLSMGIGLALAAQKKHMKHKVYVYLGDGECNEGSVWEAVMLAPQLRLTNLVAIVDYNRLQSDGDGKSIIDFGHLSQKWSSFGWDVFDVDGHHIGEILDAFQRPGAEGKPRVLIANTIKGKGISFMEGNNEWHHNRLTKAHYERALEELGEVLARN